ncbi:hypothetical protein CTheo_7469 [Ceratobasidium theobromae]|uniref:Transmembrane protein n=1 Tax=Ceratobasidium theobromae TaxID=1582974 RepID=A0A5N5QCB9_9AGAM|nr:hypothetical protein CTheo_7469 [Ceratobasidium theobromae]
MAAIGSTGTGVFFVAAFCCLALFLLYWVWAVHNRKRQQQMTGHGMIPRPSLAPQLHSRFTNDPVVRMEAGENADGLPKYTPQATVGEHTVDRGVGASGQVSNNARPGFFRQFSQFPTRPPPAYDPSVSRGS